MKSSNESDYFKLDKHKLDTEWLNQAQLFRNAAERLSKAREEYEKAKARRDLKFSQGRMDYERAKAHKISIEAKVLLEVKRMPENFGFDPDAKKAPTVDEMKAVVACDGRVQKMEEQIIQVQYDWNKEQANQDMIVAEYHRKVGDIEAEVDALKHRKSALEGLVQLWLNDYWAEPRVKGGEENRDKMREIQRKNILNKTKRSQREGEENE
jgi:hypothetical protein